MIQHLTSFLPSFLLGVDISFSAVTIKISVISCILITAHGFPHNLPEPKLRTIIRKFHGGIYENNYSHRRRHSRPRYTEPRPDPVPQGSRLRYFDLKNFSDPFRVLKGYAEALKLLRKYKPDVLFSKGGFVAVPVVLAAKHYHIPTIIHESDMTPGLANKLCIPSAKWVCCNFPETLKYLPEGKAVLTGSPIRAELLQGDRLAGLQYTNLSAAKPIILVIGGSLGSVKVNGAVRSILPKLLEQFQVIHICGKGNLDESLIGTSGYVQYEYVDSPLKHLFAAADLIVSRAGANSICEILALRKPNVLIPLSAAASRGDQILNANSFAKQGYSTVLEEEKVTDDTLFDAIHDTYENRRTFIENMEKSHLNNAIDTIMKLINDCANHK